jgi:hypothetical protein
VTDELPDADETAQTPEADAPPDPSTYVFEGEFADEKNEALAIIVGIVDGTMMPDESYELLDKADPALVYFIFRWIKKYYHGEREDSDMVRGRLSDVKNSYRSLTRKAKDGELDPIVEWFEGTYRYRELDPVAFVDLVIEKLEG